MAQIHAEALPLGGNRGELPPEVRQLLLGRAELIARGVRDPGPLLAFPRQLHIRLCQLGLKARAFLLDPLQFRLRRAQPRARLFQILSQIRFILFEPPQLRIR